MKSFTSHTRNKLELKMSYLTKPIIFAQSNAPFVSGPNHMRDLFTNQITPYLLSLGVDADDFYKAPQPTLALHQANFGRNQDRILDHMESFRCVLHLNFEHFTFYNYPQGESVEDLEQGYQTYRDRIIKSLPERLARSNWLGIIVTGACTKPILDVCDLRIHTHVVIDKTNQHGVESGKLGCNVISRKATIR